MEHFLPVRPLNFCELKVKIQPYLVHLDGAIQMPSLLLVKASLLKYYFAGDTECHTQIW